MKKEFIFPKGYGSNYLVVAFISWNFLSSYNKEKKGL